MLVGARVPRARPASRIWSDSRPSRAGGGPPRTSAPTTDSDHRFQSQVPVADSSHRFQPAIPNRRPRPPPRPPSPTTVPDRHPQPAIPNHHPRPPPRPPSPTSVPNRRPDRHPQPPSPTTVPNRRPRPPSPTVVPTAVPDRRPDRRPLFAAWSGHAPAVGFVGMSGISLWDSSAGAVRAVPSRRGRFLCTPRAARRAMYPQNMLHCLA